MNEIEVVRPDAALPALPVARTLWKPRPDFKTAANRWIKAGGAHHNVHAPALNMDFMQDYAKISGVELVGIR